MSKDKDCPLLSANSEECFDALIRAGANVNVCNSFGVYPVHQVCQKGRPDLLQTLMDHGAKLNIQDSYLWTPLLIAIKWMNSNEHFVCISMLIKADADVNICSKTNTYPLHLACTKGNIELATLLIKRHAKLNVTDDDLWTPLHFAVHSGNQAMVKLLIESGAQKRIKNRAGAYPIDLTHDPFILGLFSKNALDENNAESLNEVKTESLNEDKSKFSWFSCWF